MFLAGTKRSSVNAGRLRPTGGLSYVSYRTTVRDPVVGQTTQHAHGVTPLTCQATAETSMARDRKSSMMKLTKQINGGFKPLIKPQTDKTEGESELIQHGDHACKKELSSHTHTHTPVHVQDSAASCADVTDDHRCWKDTLSVLTNQRHIYVELLKILQNKTTDREGIHIYGFSK